MEALPGDGGAHNSNDMWWLSPDISPTKPAFSITTRFHRKASQSECVTAVAENVTCELGGGSVVVIDHSRRTRIKSMLGRKQSYEARIKLDAGQFVKFGFTASLTGAKPGAAYIFHLRQVGADGHDQGGLTVVMLAGESG